MADDEERTLEGARRTANFTLIVNVPPTTTRSDLAQAFRRFGPIELTMVVCSAKYRHPTREWTATAGYGFVRFVAAGDARAALVAATAGEVRVRGCRVRATWAKKDSFDCRFENSKRMAGKKNKHQLPSNNNNNNHHHHSSMPPAAAAAAAASSSPLSQPQLSPHRHHHHHHHHHHPHHQQQQQPPLLPLLMQQPPQPPSPQTPQLQQLSHHTSQQQQHLIPSQLHHLDSLENMLLPSPQHQHHHHHTLLPPPPPPPPPPHFATTPAAAAAAAAATPTATAATPFFPLLEAAVDPAAVAAAAAAAAGAAACHRSQHHHNNNNHHNHHLQQQQQRSPLPGSPGSSAAGAPLAGPVPLCYHLVLVNNRSLFRTTPEQPVIVRQPFSAYGGALAQRTVSRVLDDEAPTANGATATTEGTTSKVRSGTNSLGAIAGTTTTTSAPLTSDGANEAAAKAMAELLDIATCKGCCEMLETAGSPASSSSTAASTALRTNLHYDCPPRHPLLFSNSTSSSSHGKRSSVQRYSCGCFLCCECSKHNVRCPLCGAGSSDRVTSAGEAAGDALLLVLRRYTGQIGGRHYSKTADASALAVAAGGSAGNGTPGEPHGHLLSAGSTQSPSSSSAADSLSSGSTARSAVPVAVAPTGGRGAAAAAAFAAAATAAPPTASSTRPSLLSGGSLTNTPPPPTSSTPPLSSSTTNTSRTMLLV